MAKPPRQAWLPGIDDPAIPATSPKAAKGRAKNPSPPELPSADEADSSSETTETSVAPGPARLAGPNEPMVPDLNPLLPPASPLAPHPSPLTPLPSPECLVDVAREAEEEILPPPDLEGKVVYVVDAHSLIFQVFHGIPEMSSPRGEPVNAVFGFVRDILFLMQSKKPDYLFCAFDLPGPTFRDEIFDAYKAKRSETPVDLVPQFEGIQQMLAALAVPVLSVPGFEADDILATLARLSDEYGAECYLVSGDKDCRQLLTDRVKIYNVRKNLIYDAAALAQDWGIRPEQVVDFQALVGDTVDNVPGVPLIGPVIASKLLNEFGTLDGLLEKAETALSGKRRQNLLAGREQVQISRRLVRLDAFVPVPIDWRAGELGGIDVTQAQELCARFGFRRFADEIAHLDVPKAIPEAAWDHDYELIATPEDFERFFAELSRQPRFSFDTETTHIRARQAEVVGYAFSWSPGKAHYLAVRGPAGDPQLDPRKTLERLRPILENPAIKKIGQNLKYDMVVLRNVGVELAGLEFDSMVASYLLSAGERSHNLDELARRYLHHTNVKISELIGTGKQQKRMDEVPVAQVAHYAGEDADVPVRLEPILSEKLAANALDTLFHTVEIPLVEVLAELEFNGIRVDPARLAELSASFAVRLATLEQEIYALAGHPFNIGSPKQLQQILFDELKLPVVRKIQSGASTDSFVLEELAQHHPLPAKIIEYRQFAKLKNTYTDTLGELLHPVTGRVHASFNQVVAATGRLSSSDPNLQNIPIRTEEGREIRSAFLPQPGWQLLTADYSQIELRMLAHFSHDPTLCEAFAQDQDIHTLVASQVHGVSLAEVTRDMRREAKTVNFGVIYGQSAFGLAKQLGIPQEEAAKFIEAYFGRYPGIEDFLAKTLAAARLNGYVTTILGRRRSIQGVRRVLTRQRNLSERTAINTVIQGSAADLIKKSMIAIHARLRRERLASRMLLQIHDELVFEVPAREIEPLAALVTAEMTGILPLDVPLKVDLAVGPNWLDVTGRS